MSLRIDAGQRRQSHFASVCRRCSCPRRREKEGSACTQRSGPGCRKKEGSASTQCSGPSCRKKEGSSSAQCSGPSRRKKEGSTGTNFREATSKHRASSPKCCDGGSSVDDAALRAETGLCR